MVDFHVGISLPFSVEYILCPSSLNFLPPGLSLGFYPYQIFILIFGD